MMKLNQIFVTIVVSLGKNNHLESVQPWSLISKTVLIERWGNLFMGKKSIVLRIITLFMCVMMSFPINASASTSGSSSDRSIDVITKSAYGIQVLVQLLFHSISRL